MASPQFNKKATTSWWFSITYQSNNVLNNTLTHTQHMSAKNVIAKLLVDNFKLDDLHSYMHSSIKFSIITDERTAIYDKIVEVFKAPLAVHNPPLLFSVELILKTSPSNTNYMYINGSDEMNTNFLESIKAFHPKK